MAEKKTTKKSPAKKAGSNNKTNNGPSYYRAKATEEENEANIADLIGDNFGRPPKFKTPEAMQKEIMNYFAFVHKKSHKPTIMGLTVYLGFDDRSSFYNYAEKPVFSYTIKRAKAMIQVYYEMNLHGPGPTGSIFALKNFGWEDESSINHKVEPINISKTYDKPGDEKRFENE